ncbi:hypothetical protein BpHYR1_018494 [Brachionus plicatilis]|uniref:Uncharacterized protein n=1 Tax=Brachionus plicatilis TaxID=10195 RepID=A0A3M7Q9G2_BRAPC|nr:hypothetical protein BpHYR1_018494 [Brachionus plicatilis]
MRGDFDDSTTKEREDSLQNIEETIPQEDISSFRIFKYIHDRRKSSAASNLWSNRLLEEENSISATENEKTDEENSEDYELLHRPSKEEIRRRFIYNILHSIDVLLSILLFSPLVAIYWYCTWSLIDDYFYKESPKISNFLSWILGLSILFPGYVFQRDLQNLYEYLNNFETIGYMLQVTMRVVYIYAITIGVILEWRSVWNLMDIYLFESWKISFVFAILCIMFFCVTKSTHQLINTPFILYMDDYDLFFTTESKHQLPFPNYSKYGVDFLFSEIVECIALVGGWRGIEVAYDNSIFAQNEHMSIAGSFLISHSIYLFIAVVQTFIFRKFSRAKFLTRIAAEDLIYILMFFSAVLSWKFYWDVVDNFILEEKMEFPLLLLGHGAAFTVALALKVSAILVGPGTSYLKDIEYIEPPQTYFQINYLSNIFKHHLEKELEENSESRLGSQDII